MQTISFGGTHSPYILGPPNDPAVVHVLQRGEGSTTDNINKYCTLELPSEGTLIYFIVICTLQLRGQFNS